MIFTQLWFCEAHSAAFLAARLSYIFQVYLILYRSLVCLFCWCPQCRIQWLRSTQSADAVVCEWPIAQQAIEWVSSSRIPLLFVSLASTVDHHNRLCVSFFGIFPPELACVFHLNRAHFLIIVLCEKILIFIFRCYFLHFIQSNVWFCIYV